MWCTVPTPAKGRIGFTPSWKQGETGLGTAAHNGSRVGDRVLRVRIGIRAQAHRDEAALGGALRLGDRGVDVSGRQHRHPVEARDRPRTRRRSR
jgi:hypothetical protein